MTAPAPSKQRKSLQDLIKIESNQVVATTKPRKPLVAFVLAASVSGDDQVQEVYKSASQVLPFDWRSALADTDLRHKMAMLELEQDMWTWNMKMEYDIRNGRTRI